MYETFDRFLRGSTWHTNHDNDRRRFFELLAPLIRSPDFNPDQMGEHMREKTGAGIGYDNHPFRAYIDKLVSDAWAVQDFLKATS